MPAKIEIINGTFPINSTVPQDFTVPDFGVVKAVLVYSNYGGLPLDNGYMRASIGFIDQNGVQACVGSTAEINRTFSAGAVSATVGACGQSYLTDSSAKNVTFVGTLITDGVSITASNWGDGNGYSLTIILIGGDVESAVKGGFKVGARGNTNIGFTPNAGLFIQANGLNLTAKSSGNGVGFGAVTDIGGVKQRYMAGNARPSQTTMTNYVDMRNDLFGAMGNANVINSGFIHTSFGPNNGGEHIWDILGSTTTNYFNHMLYLRFADEDFAIEDFTQPDVGTSSLTTTNFNPAFSLLSGQTDTTAYTTGTARDSTNCYGFIQLFSTETYNGSFCIAYRDASADDYASSRHYNTSHVGQNHFGTTVIEATSAMITGGFEYTYTTVPTQKHLQFAILMGAGASSNIWLGDKNVTAMYKGADPIVGVYKGTEQIF